MAVFPYEGRLGVWGF